MIDLHTQAEEEICYLAMFGTSRAGLAQVQASIADHDDIREAFGEARLQPAGSDRWWTAVKAALSTWVEQIDREERGVLADFARRADRAQRDKRARDDEQTADGSTGLHVTPQQGSLPEVSPPQSRPSSARPS